MVESRSLLEVEDLTSGGSGSALARFIKSEPFDRRVPLPFCLRSPVLGCLKSFLKMTDQLAQVITLMRLAAGEVQLKRYCHVKLQKLEKYDIRKQVCKRCKIH